SRISRRRLRLRGRQSLRMRRGARPPGGWTQRLLMQVTTAEIFRRNVAGSRHIISTRIDSREPAPEFCPICHGFTFVVFATEKIECAVSRSNKAGMQLMLDDFRDPMPAEDKNVTSKIVAAALVVVGFGAVGTFLYENGTRTVMPNAPAAVAQNTEAATTP